MAYTDKELLNYMKDFYQKNKRSPTCKDFINNLSYPNYQNYTRHFGSWNNALKLTGLHITQKEKNHINTHIIKYEIEDDLLDIISHDDIKDIIRMEKERERFTKNQKKRADCRNNNLDKNSPQGKGYISEILVAKFLEIKTCFDLTNNFSHPKYDILDHEDWGMINVKSSALLYRSNSSYWYFAIHKNTRPDFFFCIGYDENRKHVESVHIIPNEQYVSTINCIKIPKSGNTKWDIFKEGENEVKKWDNLFHTLKLENCPILRNVEMVSQTHIKHAIV